MSTIPNWPCMTPLGSILNGLKASGEKITPKAWQAKIERLASHNSTLLDAGSGAAEQADATGGTGCPDPT
ncbi:hypothetical protein [Ethanoligenens sp.]|uniref:hypothetical protein n=1 Tax=Ethanoligenens sp. TaxID=2099655 RepID=UPI0039E78891